MMGPGRGGGRRGHQGKKTKLDWKTFNRLLKIILSSYKVQLIIVVVAIVISSLASVAGSVFLRILIDSYITPIGTVGLAATMPLLLKALGTMLLIYLAGILASFIYNILMVTVSQGVLREIRSDMFTHMQTLPIKYFDTRSHGDMMSLYTNDTNTLRQMVTQSIPNFISSMITVVAIFFAMLFTSWQLTIVVLFSLSAMLFISSRIASQSGTHFVAQQKTIGATNGYIEEMISGQRVVQTFTYEKRAKEAFDKLNDQLFEDAFNANRYANILMPIMGNISYIQWVIVAIVGGSLAISGLAPLTLGAIASFLQLSRTINRPINQMAQQLNSVAMALAGTRRIFELLDQESEQDSGHITLAYTERAENGSLRACCDTQHDSWAWEDSKRDALIPLTGHVELDHVDFGYVEDTLVLQDITIEAQPGTKVALVGATGAGKTTITNLINRFYDLDDGKIRYDGININRIRKEDLRASLGVVLQDIHLFSDTVMENIRYGRLDATDEEVIEAAKLANADFFISHLPEGYQTQLTGSGSALSQGQRQLISIARAIVANPPVLVLDEATSSIDTHTEAIVQQGMDALMAGRTVFVIAHRLSTIRNADQIIVLDEGKIAEAGSHEELLALEGLYWRLYTGSFELE